MFFFFFLPPFLTIYPTNIPTIFIVNRLYNKILLGANAINTNEKKKSNLKKLIVENLELLSNDI